jgi:hypothetical protein
MIARELKLWVMMSVVAPSTILAQGPVTPSGAGSKASPYQISQLGHLVWMGTNVGSSSGKYYMLQNNIDASATAGWDNGAGFAPIGTYASQFKGVFDGKGREIRNLTVNRSSGDVGLFGCVGGPGVLKDVGVSGGMVVGGDWAGGLVGVNLGTLSNCYASGSVTGATQGAGGLVGANVGVGGYAGRILKCYATGSVGGWKAGGLVALCDMTGSPSPVEEIVDSYATADVTGQVVGGGLVGALCYGSTLKCYASGSVNGGRYAGGLIGSIGMAYVNQCYATGSVMGTNLVGGLIGEAAYADVSECYAVGPVTGVGANARAGGLVGESNEIYAVTVINSYWDVQTCGQSGSDGGVGKTTAQMKQQATFVGWDFADLWSIDEGVTYPLFSLPPHMYTPVIGQDNTVTIRWSSVTNNLYTVHHSTNLLNGFGVLQGKIQGTPPMNSYTDTVNGVQMKFWKVTTEE